MFAPGHGSLPVSSKSDWTCAQSSEQGIENVRTWWARQGLTIRAIWPSSFVCHQLLTPCQVGNRQERNVWWFDTFLSVPETFPQSWTIFLNWNTACRCLQGFHEPDTKENDHCVPSTSILSLLPSNLPTHTSGRCCAHLPCTFPAVNGWQLWWTRPPKVTSQSHKKACFYRPRNAGSWNWVFPERALWAFILWIWLLPHIFSTDSRTNPKGSI